jgi:hypothetical protein
VEDLGKVVGYIPAVLEGLWRDAIDFSEGSSCFHIPPNAGIWSPLTAELDIDKRPRPTEKIVWSSAMSQRITTDVQVIHSQWVNCGPEAIQYMPAGNWPKLLRVDTIGLERIQEGAHPELRVQDHCIVETSGLPCSSDFRRIEKDTPLAEAWTRQESRRYELTNQKGIARSRPEIGQELKQEIQGNNYFFPMA